MLEFNDTIKIVDKKTDQEKKVYKELFGLEDSVSGSYKSIKDRE